MLKKFNLTFKISTWFLITAYASSLFFKPKIAEKYKINITLIFSLSSLYDMNNITFFFEIFCLCTSRLKNITGNWVSLFTYYLKYKIIMFYFVQEIQKSLYIF